MIFLEMSDNSHDIFKDVRGNCHDSFKDVRGTVIIVLEMSEELS